jgi:Bacterial SH3 domain
VTTPRHRRSALSRRTRRAVVVAVSAFAVAFAVVTTRPSEATDASIQSKGPLTVIQSAQRGIERADRSTERTALPSTSTSASAGANTKPPTPATAKPSSESAAAAKAATKKPAPVPAVVGHRFATTALKVRATASTRATVRKVIPRGARIGITGAVIKTWTQTVIDGKTAWVSKAYLSTSRPTVVKPSSGSASSAVTTTGGFSTAACTTGSSMESGLTSNAVRVHRAACASFPSVRRFGGIGPTGEHAAGRAVDIMVRGDSLGDAISAWARTNAGALHISEVIWSQHIWTVQRGSEGWRPMSDRGSATANHYDHVHVTVY